MRYRVFIQDVGKDGYSGLRDVAAPTSRMAVQRTEARGNPWIRGKLIALPFNRKELWPDSKTGKVPKEALEFK